MESGRPCGSDHVPGPEMGPWPRGWLPPPHLPVRRSLQDHKRHRRSCWRTTRVKHLPAAEQAHMTSPPPLCLNKQCGLHQNKRLAVWTFSCCWTGQQNLMENRKTSCAPTSSCLSNTIRLDASPSNQQVAVHWLHWFTVHLSVFSGSLYACRITEPSRPTGLPVTWFPHLDLPPCPSSSLHVPFVVPSASVPSPTPPHPSCPPQRASCEAGGQYWSSQ